MGAECCVGDLVCVNEIQPKMEAVAKTADVTLYAIDGECERMSRSLDTLNTIDKPRNLGRDLRNLGHACNVTVRVRISIARKHMTPYSHAILCQRSSNIKDPGDLERRLQTAIARDV